MMDSTELNQDQLEAIIPAGIDFLRVLTEQLGNDRGMEVWETIGEALGPDIKGQIFFAMLTGETGYSIHCRSVNNLNNAVNIIKAIRMATGMGLKEAKDTYDTFRDQHAVTFKIQKGFARSHVLQQLRDYGVDCY